MIDEARDLRQATLEEDRRLRVTGDIESADRRLAEASRELGRINRMLPATDRIPGSRSEPS